MKVDAVVHEKQGGRGQSMEEKNSLNSAGYESKLKDASSQSPAAESADAPEYSGRSAMEHWVLNLSPEELNTEIEKELAGQ